MPESHFNINSSQRVLFLFLITAGLIISASCSQNETLSPSELERSLNYEPEQVVGIGRIEPKLRILDLTSEVPGIVKEINFFPGDLVKKKQIILSLVSTLEKARVEQKKAQIQTQKSRIMAAEAALSAVKIRTENARVNFMRAKSLYEKNAETKNYFDQAKTEYDALLEETKRLEAELVAAKDLLNQERVTLELAQKELSLKSVKAISNGKLLSLDITVGSYLYAGRAFGAFAPQSPLIARCEIDELFADQIKVGQEAHIRKQGETRRLVEGMVSFVGHYLRRQSIFSDEVDELVDLRVREVEISLENGTELLIGSRIECVIELTK
jgi:multidrug efflux pump subunit AcrA (membrane-fusion protein)